jgi:hypothetical protein
VRRHLRRQPEAGDVDLADLAGVGDGLRRRDDADRVGAMIAFRSG